MAKRKGERGAGAYEETAQQDILSLWLLAADSDLCRSCRAHSGQ